MTGERVPSGTPPAAQRGPSRRALALLAMAGGAALLTALAVPGVYNLDENNYLVTLVGLRNGSLALDNTAGLPPTSALYWFDPTVGARSVHRSPAVSNAPPLYAFFALPFSTLGFRGLIFLNALSFMVAALLTFLIARRVSAHPHAGWIALSCFAVGGFALEYAQGAWPQMLSVALTTGAIFFLVRLIREDTPRLAAVNGAAVGLLAACAAGVRYQNAILLLLIVTGAVVWARRRVNALGGIVAGALLPLALSSWLNYLRLGSWNPISKGPGYVTLATAREQGGGLSEALLAFWAKVFDFSAHPPIPFGPILWAPDKMGGFLHGSAIKKAWLQASPILALALVAFAAAWLRRDDTPERRAVRMLSLLVGGMLALFAAAGTGRHDGLSFNPRYFLELTPLAAVAVASSLAGVQLKLWPAAIGFGTAVLTAALVVSIAPGDPLRSALILQLPLALAVLALASWGLWRLGRTGDKAVVAFAAACIGWAATIHVGSDVAQVRRMRAFSAEQFRLLADVIPDRAAYLGAAHVRDAAGPLILEKDLVILEPEHDLPGALAVARQLHARGYRLFFDSAELAPDTIARFREALVLTVVVPGPDPLYEATPRPGG